MIKANELRIGNWILENGKYCQVDEIRHWYFGDSEPIELTTEILEKCGFAHDEDGIYELDCGRKAFRYQIEPQSIIYRCDIGMDWADLNCDVEHLHQLQNLYFALTNEELEVKL